jgi:aconitate hydratase
LPEPVSKAIEAGSLVAAAVLSGNRNFEGRVHAEVRANYLASPPLVVAYALAGTVDFDPYKDSLGTGRDGKPVMLKDIWPTRAEVEKVIEQSIDRTMFERIYGAVFDGDAEWKKLSVPSGDLYAWDTKSTYVKLPPYFEGMPREPGAIADIANARVLLMLGDSITTDHISPAGSIKKSSPAGLYLIEHGVDVKDFNQYGARRGNDEVMVRGTFANVRLRNLLAPGTEGGVTRHLPSGDSMSVYDAAVRYAKEGVQLVVLAGKEYGSGSSRDWAAKGPKLLGVRMVIAESYERIHRSNLVGMGILPLEFASGETTASLGLTGDETFSVADLAGAVLARRATVVARRPDGAAREFSVTVRIDTPQEREYYRHGGILQFVLRQLLSRP